MEGRRPVTAAAEYRRSSYNKEIRRPGQSIDPRRLKGFSVFVDNVSKRIHHLTLKEAFLTYGEVVDVFMAYKNRSRRNKLTTFAFVRFRTEREARMAINKGNGRLMDGFQVRISAANRNRQRQPQGSDTVRSNAKRRTFPLRDTRSYKEALLGPRSTSGPAARFANKETAQFYNNETIVCLHSDSETTHLTSIPQADLTWRECCLVGKIKAMYNVEMVQEGLVSDGFQAQLCPWYDLLVVIHCHSKTERDRCWTNREELLRLWFEELELLEGYEGKKKVKATVRLFDVPLSVWSKTFFENLGNRWGSVLKIDDDTLACKRFDEASLLLQVQNISDIPDRIVLSVNGAIKKIRIKTEVFEEDRIFIDGDSSPRVSEADMRRNASFHAPNALNAADIPLVSPTTFEAAALSGNRWDNHPHCMPITHVDTVENLQVPHPNSNKLFEVPVCSDDFSNTQTPLGLQGLWWAPHYFLSLSLTNLSFKR
ncbi:hypothetical protein HRI_005003100 [Hibiscus trionum]|uniref:RRM domain-containing protein n=1 Tax=Hibiscus trionum TaxID=183268 RepID=A0A9W7JH88_HIBTR|nr:hypothetical protein HRI_005003100 [Hibiscus trionum]